jgi:hypothetical protein
MYERPPRSLRSRLLLTRGRLRLQRESFILPLREGRAAESGRGSLARHLELELGVLRGQMVSDVSHDVELGLLKSNVTGNSALTSTEGTITGPGVCPNPKKRAARRASASFEFTGNVSW